MACVRCAWGLGMGVITGCKFVVWMVVLVSGESCRKTKRQGRDSDSDSDRAGMEPWHSGAARILSFESNAPAQLPKRRAKMKRPSSATDRYHWGWTTDDGRRMERSRLVLDADLC